MSADPKFQQSDATALGLSEPLYFDAGDHCLFGWLHRPAQGRVPSMGLVICNPFGYEAICSHRSLRAFAEAAAAMGIPTLRFDYVGTGDSAEIDPQADQMNAWSLDIGAAVGELQRLTGVERVCLLGVRLGALLAVRAANRCEAVNALILVAPIINGNRYLRELRTAVLAASLATSQASAPKSKRADKAGQSPESMEVGGFSLSTATLSALALTDIDGLELPNVSGMLVIDGHSHQTSRAWAEKLSRTGMPTRYAALQGLVEMIMTAPQFASIPQQMIAETQAWLRQFSGYSAQTSSVAGRHFAAGSGHSSTVMYLRQNGSSGEGMPLERPVFLTSAPRLFAIVTEPREGEARHRAVILLNAGADYHIGASGMYVGLARRWARRGYVVLRMDLAGLGDSDTRPGRPEDEIFPPAAIDDIRAAIDWMRNHYSVKDITLGGVCSGAYHTLRAAAAALLVNRILMVNPENFFWKEGMTVKDMQMAELVRNPTLYRERLFSAAAWKKLTTGQVNVRYILRIYVHRLLLAVESTFRDLARYMRIHVPGDLGWELEQIGKRGVQVVFVFARGEPGIDLLEILGGLSVKRLGSRCKVHIIDSADHVFSRSGPRAILEKILSDELYSRLEWTNATPIELKQNS